MSTTSQTTKVKTERRVEIDAAKSAADALSRAAEEATFLEAAGYAIRWISYTRHDPLFDKARPTVYSMTLMAEKDRP